MLLYLITFYQHVIGVDLHVLANLVLEDLANQVLISGSWLLLDAMVT